MVGLLTGLRIGLTPKRGTKIVRIRLYRGKKLLLTTFRTIRGTKRQTLVVRGNAIRRLKAGRYRVEVAPGTKGTQLAPATSRGFVLVR